MNAFKHLEGVQRTHPRVADNPLAKSFLAALESTIECMASCLSCADACLHEEHVAKMRECIHTCLDCAAVCEATSTMLTRPHAASVELLRSQLEACVLACRACGQECARHAENMEHCAHCRDACQACAKDCEKVLGG